MRVYLDGKLSTKQETFLPAGLWFATENCDDNTEVSEECLRLDGITCESSVDGNEFSCRWKGTEIHYVKNGEEIETEDFTLEEFVSLITEKKMRLENMDAYYDDEVNVTITGLTIVEGDKEYEFDVSLADEIEFIGDGE
jgi:uncharacterized protein YacL (UPF0231 family)